MPGTQPVTYLRLVRSDEDDGEDSIKSQGREPWWWCALIIGTLKFGHWWFSPLWPIYRVLKLLRSLSIYRAFKALRNELKVNNRTGHISFKEFIDIEAARRDDHRFHAACEKALQNSRVGDSGLYVILNEEIDGLGQSAFIRHMAWVTKQSPHPLPTERQKGAHLREAP